MFDSSVDALELYSTSYQIDTEHNEIIYAEYGLLEQMLFF